MEYFQLRFPVASRRHAWQVDALLPINSWSDVEALHRQACGEGAARHGGLVGMLDDLWTCGYLPDEIELRCEQLAGTKTTDFLSFGSSRLGRGGMRGLLMSPRARESVQNYELGRHRWRDVTLHRRGAEHLCHLLCWTNDVTPFIVWEASAFARSDNYGDESPVPVDVDSHERWEEVKERSQLLVATHLVLEPEAGDLVDCSKYGWTECISTRLARKISETGLTGLAPRPAAVRTSGAPSPVAAD